MKTINSKDINIILLSEIPNHEHTAVICQIAKWHYSEWGKYWPGSTEQDWINNLTENSSKPSNTIILAMNSNNQFVGSVSLKTEYMQDTFPQYTPWLSGLYIKSEYRGKNVSSALINRLAEIAIEKGYKEFFVFSHHLDLENFYKKLGGKLITQTNGEKYIYKNAPILLFRINSSAALINTSKYISN